MIANPGSRNCCSTSRTARLRVVRGDGPKPSGTKSSSRLYPSSTQAFSFTSRKRRVSGSITSMASFDWSSSVRNSVSWWCASAPAPARRANSSLVARCAFSARTRSVTSCAIPRTIGVAYSLGSQRVVILPDPLLSSIACTIAITPRDFPGALDLAQVDIELIPELWIDKIPSSASGAVFYGVTQETR